ncbi:hypothetical protein ACI65C_013838 [Semiaphis heraclei]
MVKRKSWVWDFAKREGDRAFCDLCDGESNNEYSCVGGTTGSLIRHLQNFHGIAPPDESVRKRLWKYYELYNKRTWTYYKIIIMMLCNILIKASKFCDVTSVNRECNSEKTEQIHQALASLIAMNQLPISFCSSPGFCQFMAVVELNYKVCRDEAMKKGLHSLKSKVENKIKNELRNVKSLVCTTDGWCSMAQNSYISLTAHIITNGFQNNAKNVVNAVKLLHLTINNENMDVTCAAHSLQLAISTALKDKIFSELIKQCSSLVGHFKHSNVAKQSLFKKQEQLGIPHQSLVQYCKTRWNSIYLMLDRLLQNRTSILNVLTDRTVTSLYIAQKLEITESHWLKIEILVSLLKPLFIVTNLFCSENHSPASMVRPLLAQLMENHLKEKENDDQIVTYFKRTIIHEIKAI